MCESSRQPVIVLLDRINGLLETNQTQNIFGLEDRTWRRWVKEGASPRPHTLRKAALSLWNFVQDARNSERSADVFECIKELVPSAPLEASTKASFIDWWVQLAENPALADSATRVVELPPDTRLTGRIDLRFWDPQSGYFETPERCQLPARTNWGLSVTLTFDRAAHPCVIWFSSSGAIQPLFPWLAFDWTKPSTTAPGTSFVLPSLGPTRLGGFYPIDSQPGVETGLVLASEKPIQRSALSQLRSGCNKFRNQLPRELPDQSKVYWLEDPRGLLINPHATRLGPPIVAKAPLEKWIQQVVRNLGHAFPCILGVSFSTRAEA